MITVCKPSRSLTGYVVSTVQAGRSKIHEVDQILFVSIKFSFKECSHLIVILQYPFFLGDWTGPTSGLCKAFSFTKYMVLAYLFILDIWI